jgi:hypothetical protein
MPFTVLKIHKRESKRVEVIAEVDSESEANQVAGDAHASEDAHEYDFLVEAPPSETGLI